MRKIISDTLWLCLLLLSPMVIQAADQVSVSATGESQFYKQKEAALNIARMNASTKLYGLCEKEGLKFYEGKHQKSHIFSRVEYSNKKCNERNDRGKVKCSIKATGQCISKVNEYFNIRCGKDKKNKITGRSVLFRGGIRIIADNGTVYNINKATLESDEPYGILCKGSVDPSGHYAKRWGKYLFQKIENLLDTCAEFRKKKGGIVPDECKPPVIKDSNPGGVLG